MKSARTIFFTALIFSIAFFSSCGKKKEVIRSGVVEFMGDKWNEEFYIDHDSAFVEYRYPGTGELFYYARAASQKEMNDSTFSAVYYYRNGKIHASFSKEKKIPCGTWIENFESGAKGSSTEFKNGSMVSITTWWENGKVHVESHTEADGRMLHNEFYENGNPSQQLMMDSTWKGSCVNFFRNGKKQSEGNSMMGSPAGIWHRWDSLGNALRDTLYGLPELK
ncbi:MAG TPA: hypothetical protein VL651_03625 [Bacteroidia bacterium]|nr:hypothetical protein [Bacteroidia bacterium]